MQNRRSLLRLPLRPMVSLTSFGEEMPKVPASQELITSEDLQQGTNALYEGKSERML